MQWFLHLDACWYRNTCHIASKGSIQHNKWQLSALCGCLLTLHTLMKRLRPVKNVTPSELVIGQCLRQTGPGQAGHCPGQTGPCPRQTGHCPGHTGPVQSEQQGSKFTLSGDVSHSAMMSRTPYTRGNYSKLQLLGYISGVENRKEKKGRTSLMLETQHIKQSQTGNRTPVPSEHKAASPGCPLWRDQERPANCQ